MNKILDRIIQEENAKSLMCDCVGCFNIATHTWSGHPTCDECGTPGRKKLPFPVLITKEDKNI